MHDELMYLEPDEEITAIIDRIRLSAAGAVRLVVPKGALVLQSLVSLKLLQRESARLEKTIALVTNDGIGLHLAEAANLTVFAKAKDDQPVYQARTKNIEHREQKMVGPQPTDQVAVGEEAASKEDGFEMIDDQPIQDSGSASADLSRDESEAKDAPKGVQVHHYTLADHQAEAGAKQTVNPAVRSNAILKEARRQAGGQRSGRNWSKLLTLLVSLGLLAAGGYLGFLELAPRATVILTLATEPFVQAATLVADTNLAAPDTSNARLPGVLHTVPVTISHKEPATGKKQVGTKATATLTLANYWDANPQTFPIGTQFRVPDGTSFLTTGAATIPGATTTLKEGKVVTTPGTTSVTIEAVQAGTEANGKTGRFTIPSLATVRQDRIYGELVGATAGGTNREVTIVSASDLENLKNSGRQQAAEQGKNDLLKEVAGGRLLEGAYQLAIESETVSEALGAETETIELALVGTMKGIVVRDEDLRAVTMAVIRQAIPSGRTQVPHPSDTITASASDLSLTAGTVQIRSEVATSTALSFDQQSFLNAVAGQTLAEAESISRHTSGVSSVAITIKPRWLGKLPKRDDQISLVTEYAATPRSAPGDESQP